ncbi:Golgi phospho protein 3-domain-containing protein [Blyttiomyces helicus]|uniref:Golgi phospho protein 3-domain-containing protein n=1 Tax=Blyttiomyces helicus TaxID=388810 RepID=A0A4P9W5Z3_9FUNG|nr:Golgi phospho protein 3-domain-containing protein [Blyttiomyces helicus]|eukprot:RKO85526.1 Golgi phospho protein 3-domain-containing protein [Blyttiomyces helicus]
MASSGGLTQRRRNAGDAIDEYDSPTNRESSTSIGGNADAGRDDKDQRAGVESDDDADGKGSKGNKLTLLEEVLLLGLKDAQGYLSFWNDNISYVLRGCILIELSLRNRISTVKESRKRPYAEKLLEVVDERVTGEVLLDEALKLIKIEKQNVGNWIDLMSGETWNLMKIGYQLKQVRERIAKGLVDKGVLRTEKRNFVLFDMATHPVADHTIKEQLIQRTVDCLLGRGPPADRRTIAMVCAAYAANVLENALVGLSHSQREAAFQKVDEILQEHAALTEKAKAVGTTEIMAGVLSVYTKMDSLL